MALKSCVTSACQISFESKSFPRGDYRQIWCRQNLLKLYYFFQNHVTSRWWLYKCVKSVSNESWATNYYQLPAIIIRTSRNWAELADLVSYTGNFLKSEISIFKWNLWKSDIHRDSPQTFLLIWSEIKQIMVFWGL